MELPYPVDASHLGALLVALIEQKRLDEADSLLQNLYDVFPATRKLLIFPVSIAIQRGHLREAWQLVNGLPDDEAPELKALCLNLLGDPLWHSYAVEQQNSKNPYVRSAMRRLLGLPTDPEG